MHDPGDEIRELSDANGGMLDPVTAGFTVSTIETRLVETPVAPLSAFGSTALGDDFVTSTYESASWPLNAAPFSLSASGRFDRSTWKFTDRVSPGGIVSEPPAG